MCQTSDVYHTHAVIASINASFTDEVKWSASVHMGTQLQDPGFKRGVSVWNSHDAGNLWIEVCDDEDAHVFRWDCYCDIEGNFEISEDQHVAMT